MKPLDYFVARQVVATFNKTRCVRETARQLKLAKDVVREVSDWLWNRTFHKETVARSTTLPQIKISADVWCEYLYSTGVTPEDAAESLAWPLERVLACCGGEKEWRKQKRKPLYARARMVDTQARDEDLSEEEIYAAAAEVRKQWSETDARLQERPTRVEARQYVFDGHDPRVFRAS